MGRLAYVASVVLVLFVCAVIYLQWAGLESMQQHKAVWPWDAPPTYQGCTP